MHRLTRAFQRFTMPKPTRKNKGGRPWFFDGDTCAFIAMRLEQSKSIKSVAEELGIGYSTIQRWLRYGREGNHHFHGIAMLAQKSITQRNKFNSFRKVKRYLAEMCGNP